MGFNKPFRAVPIEPGARYRQRRTRQRRPKALAWLGGAALAGAAIGVVSVNPGDVASLLKAPRERAPQEGDHWSGCNAARRAGTAPIYAGEPGYRREMDGDLDGIACEPYHGS